jgi:serine/threonine protein kinase
MKQLRFFNMPIELNVRAQTGATLDTNTFGNTLKNQLASVDGKAKISELRTYIGSKKNNAQIRVVNTTKDKDLALQVKSWGHGKTYRQERTAETLKQLLSRAGMPAAAASRVVDDVLKPGGNHRIATARLIKDILNDAEVIFALAAHPAPVTEPQPPVQVGTAHNDAGPVNPLEKIRGEFKNPRTLDMVRIYIQQGIASTVFKHASGGEAEFRHLAKGDVMVAPSKGRLFGEDELYREFNQQNPKVQQQEGPPDKYLLQELVDGQAKGPVLFSSRKDLLEQPQYQQKQFKVLATIKLEAAANVSDAQGLEQPLAHGNALIEPALIEPHLIEPDGGKHVFREPAHLPSAQINAPKTPFTIINNSSAPFDLAMDKFLAREGLNPGEVLGKGAFGVVKLASIAQGDESFVAKYFTDGNNPKPVKLSLNRDVNQMNEAYAAYLVKTKDARWQPPKVIAPTHYIVGRPNAFNRNATDIELVPTAELKNTIRENAMWPMSRDLSCYGLVMAKAPGEEVEKQLNDLSTNDGARAQMAKSGLESLRSLNQRGFIHRDIKPANLLFDGTDVSFIDTGMLFKVQKTAADQEATSETIPKSQAEQERASKLPVRISGTPKYLHPNLVRQRAIGTQADLHAFGLVLLNAESPLVFNSLYSSLFPKPLDMKTLPITPQNIRMRIDGLIEMTKASSDPTLVTLNQSAKALKLNIDNPDHPAHLAMLCLTKAATTQPGFSAVNWANRKFSDSQYQELLAHPALDLASRGASQ